MIKILTVLILLFCIGCTSSSDFIYGNAGKTITVVKWQNEKFIEIQKVEGAPSPGAMAYSEKYQIIYTSTGSSAKNKIPNGRIFSIQPDGTLKLKQTITFPHGYAQFTVDNSNKFLMGASYSSGYNDIFKLDEQGIPHLTDTVYEGKNTAHAILFSPHSKNVYVPYVKQFNSLHQYSLDFETGRLKPLNPPKAEVGTNAGPRHFAMHPQKPVVYTSNEQAIGVSVYHMNSNGTLNLKQVCAANDSQPGKGKSASSLVATADGKYVFSAQRGQDPKHNFIHTYRVLEDGSLKPSGKMACDHIPWIIKLSSDGKYLFVSASTAGTLTAFKIQKDGRLTEVANLPWGANRHMVVIGE